MMMRLLPMVMSVLMVGTCGVINLSRRVLTIRTMPAQAHANAHIRANWLSLMCAPVGRVGEPAMAMRVVRLIPPTVMGVKKSLRVQSSMPRAATTGMSSRSMSGTPGRVTTKSMSPNSPASPAQKTVPIGGGVAWVRFSKSSAASRTTGVGVSVMGLMTRMSPWVRWH